MGKHSAPRNNVVPARLAMLSTATLIGLAVSANGGAAQAIADDANSTSASDDGGWVAPPKRAVVSVAPVSYQQQARPEAFTVAPAELPVHRADRSAVQPGGNAKPRTANPGGTGKPGGNTAPLAAIVDTLATGSAALPAPLRAVLDDLVKQVGPVLAKGLIQLITSNNQPSPTPAPSTAPRGRHAAPAPAAAVTEDDSDDLGSDETDDLAADVDDNTDDIAAADTYLDDTTDSDDLAVTDTADAVLDADADWQPLALGPTTVG